MNISILRVNKSTAKRSHIILLLPFITAMVKIKIFLSVAILAAAFTAVAYSIQFLCRKYLSVVVAYPISLTIIGLLSVSLAKIPDFFGFSIKLSIVPAVFLTLFIYKYIGAVKNNKLIFICTKYLTISCGALILSSICEIASLGTLFDFKIHNHPIQYFSTYSGIFLILALITAIINIIAGDKIDINKSFNMKKGSIRLISYSAITAFVIVSVSTLINNYILIPLNISYTHQVIICFLCGISFIGYRLFDKEFKIGKHAANFIPSMALLFSLAVQTHSPSLTLMMLHLLITYLIFVFAVYVCEIISMRKSLIDVRNPLAGAPSTLLIFSVASVVLDNIQQHIQL